MSLLACACSLPAYNQPQTVLEGGLVRSISDRWFPYSRVVSRSNTFELAFDVFKLVDKLSYLVIDSSCFLCQPVVFSEQIAHISTAVQIRSHVIVCQGSVRLDKCDIRADVNSTMEAI